MEEKRLEEKRFEEKRFEEKRFEEKRPSQQLTPDRKALSEHKRNAWFVVAMPDQTAEELLDPSVWAHHCRDLRPWDKIEVIADDGTWYAEYLVTAVERTWARVAPVLKVNLTTQDVSQTEAEQATAAGFEVKFRGQHLRWSVIRVKDAAVVQEKMNSRGEAFSWLKEHLKVM